jgi:WD40 repeat protein
MKERRFSLFFVIVFLFIFANVKVFSSGNISVENYLRINTISMQGRIFSVLISPDNKQVAAETISGYKVFDISSGRELYTFLKTDKHIRFVYSPDGSQIMCPINNEIKIWDSQTGVELKTLVKMQAYFSDSDDVYGDEWSYNDGWKSSIYPQKFWSAIYSPDGKYIAALCSILGDRGGYQDNCIRIWDVQTGRQLLDNMRTPAGKFIFYSNDGKNIGCYSIFSEFYSFDALTGQEKDISSNEFFPINMDARPFPTDWAFEWNTTNHSWKYKEYSHYYFQRKLDYSQYQNDDFLEYELIAFSPDGNRLTQILERENKFYLQLFDTVSGHLLSAHLGNLPFSVKPVSVHYNPQGTRIVCAFIDGLIRIWDSGTGEEIQIRQNNIGGGVLSSAKFSKNGNLFVIGTSDGNIIILGK